MCLCVCVCGGGGGSGGSVCSSPADPEDEPNLGTDLQRDSESPLRIVAGRITRVWIKEHNSKLRLSRFCRECSWCRILLSKSQEIEGS